MNRILLLLFYALTSAACLAQSDQTLADRYDRMYQSGRYELAYNAAEQILERHPDSAWWQFNAGVVLAKLDKPDEALVRLRKSAELGFSGLRSFEQNSDLDSLRELDEFAAVVGLVKDNVNKRIGEFKTEAKKHNPLTYVPETTDDEPKPALIIALHGTGMTGQDMHNALLPVATEMGVALVSPDALRPAGNGFSWTYRDESEWFVEHLIERISSEHRVDPSRTILIGFSQGANIALIMGQTHSDKFIGVVPICGHYEEQVAASDVQPAPFYLMMGARDPWKRTYTKARKVFDEAGGEVQLRILTGRGHELPSGSVGFKEYKKALIWIFRQESSESQSDG
jgi:predicted esterase